MLTLIDTPPFLEGMEKQAKQLAVRIAWALRRVATVRTLPKDAELQEVSPSSLIHIINGVFRCQHGNKTIRLYSSGDLLVAPAADAPGSGGLRITSEFGAEIAVVAKSDFLAGLAQDTGILSDWLDYQALETRIAHLLCSLYIGEEVRPEPQLRQYDVGAVIIRENDDPEEVYEMIQGSASVVAQGHELSVIKEGEVFGELSFFTGLKRTATVTALEPCLVQIIDQRDFLRIMKYRPAMVEEMVRTLCHRLVDLNAKVVQSKS